MKKIIYRFLILASLIISFSQCYAQQSERITFGKGYLEYHEGVPFLWLEGSNYEVGFQYGKLLKKEIESMFHDFSILREQKLGIDNMSFFKQIFYNLFGESIISKKVGKVVKELPKDIHEIIKGVAAGAEVPIQTLYEINLWHDISGEGIECSSILIKKNNRIVHAWNHDAPMEIVGKHVAVTNFKINGKNSYTQFGVIAQLYTVSGINEAGISISINSSSQLKNYKKENCNVHANLNKIMTDCSNLNNVESLLDTINLNIGYILSIASHKENKAAMFDVFGEICVRTDVGEVLYAPNHIVSPLLSKKYENRNSQDFNNTAREDKFNELYYQENTTELINKVANILACADFYHYTSGLQTSTTINNNLTAQSVIFDPTNHSFYLASGSAFAAWSKRLRYNTQTKEVSVFREEDKRLRAKETIDFLKYIKASKNFENTEEVAAFYAELKSKGLENFGTLSNAFNNYYNLKDYGLAKQEGLKLVEKYPDIITSSYYVGRAYELEGNFKEAISWYIKSLKAPITNEYRELLAKMHLAFAYHGLGDLGQAKTYADQALKLYRQYYIPENDKDFIRLEEINIQAK